MSLIYQEKNIARPATGNVKFAGFAGLISLNTTFFS